MKTFIVQIKSCCLFHEYEMVLLGSNDFKGCQKALAFDALFSKKGEVYEREISNN